MKTYEFDVLLLDLSEIEDEHAEALFQAGCDDGTLASRNHQAWIHFDRKADTLEEAIRSALAQVRSAGFKVSRVELDTQAAALLNASSNSA